MNEAVAAARPSAGGAAAGPPSPARRVPVIGLVGGIGAGKSEVARILERLGCVVVDSDLEARAALERPDVRDRLVQWWGPRILAPDGRIDRRAVASIVFADAEERRRLEELVHPVIRAARAEVVQRERRRAAGGGAHARALIIDAPLLYEAGVDRECDAVVFVDAPRAVRLERVSRTRGWTEADLALREAAQLPPEEKRRRADQTVVNAGSLEELGEAVRAALVRIEAGLQHRAAGGGHADAAMPVGG